jgi:hypothetical protein
MKMTVREKDQIMHPKFIDVTSYIVAAVTFVFSLLLFYSQSAVFWDSFAAAILAAGCIWIAYVLTRWLFLALK